MTGIAQPPRSDGVDETAGIQPVDANRSARVKGGDYWPRLSVASGTSPEASRESDIVIST